MTFPGLQTPLRSPWPWLEPHGKMAPGETPPTAPESPPPVCVPVLSSVSRGGHRRSRTDGDIPGIAESISLICFLPPSVSPHHPHHWNQTELPLRMTNPVCQTAGQTDKLACRQTVTNCISALDAESAFLTINPVPWMQRPAPYKGRPVGTVLLSRPAAKRGGQREFPPIQNEISQTRASTEPGGVGVFYYFADPFG